jgi:hypothetical protein
MLRVVAETNLKYLALDEDVNPEYSEAKHGKQVCSNGFQNRTTGVGENMDRCKETDGDLELGMMLERMSMHIYIYIYMALASILTLNVDI